MAVFLFIVLVSAGVLLATSGAQDNFGKLSDDYKKGVKLAVQQINSHAGAQSHFLFFKSLEKSDIDGGFGVNYVYHRFYVKSTRCPKITLNANPTKCAFKYRPLIDCGICYKMYKGEMQTEPKPYVHCVHKPRLTQDMIAARKDHCSKLSYGSPSCLASQGRK